MRFTCFGVDTMTRILVTNCPLANGNSYAYLEILKLTPNDIWYCEYGINPTRELIGISGIDIVNGEFIVIDPLSDDDFDDNDLTGSILG